METDMSSTHVRRECAFLSSVCGSNYRSARAAAAGCCDTRRCARAPMRGARRPASPVPTRPESPAAGCGDLCAQYYNETGASAITSLLADIERPLPLVDSCEVRCGDRGSAAPEHPAESSHHVLNFPISARQVYLLSIYPGIVTLRYHNARSHMEECAGSPLT
ncbi:hypothetical protein EVAR_76530_1 [Eumeta japonica]|uniref:Uncharacterized protein n=1 Tax=Eumeta variegata TaxID=151549 RepID=A0A4C1T7I8_EUMVA|nr:hypothetical protein EVAR_76530_1 [Eumeta japonica]